MFLWCVRDGWRDIYSERGLLLPIFSSRSQGVQTLAPTCKLVRDASGWLRVPRSTAILCILSKSHRVVLITWSPSGYTPVRPECSDRAVRFTNQNVTACQAHGVTRNEPKFHGVCYITKAMIDKTIQNCRCRLCGDRDKTINHIISKYSNLAPKEYWTRHNWVGKMIHWELCKRFKFDHTNKCYMHNPESVLEKERPKLQWDFEIQTDHLISARRPDLVIVIKKKQKRESLPNIGLCRSGWLLGKTGKKAKREISTQTLLEKKKKLSNMKVTVMPIVIGTLRTVTKELIQELENLEIRGWVGTIKTTAMLRLAWILGRVLEILVDLVTLRIQWKPIR